MGEVELWAFSMALNEDVLSNEFIDKLKKSKYAGVTPDAPWLHVMFRKKTDAFFALNQFITDGYECDKRVRPVYVDRKYLQKGI